MKRHKQTRSNSEAKAAAALAKIPTEGQRGKLGRMHRYRREAIMRRMEKGLSYSAADKNTQHVFDTVDWREVERRLQRFRGIVCGIGIILAEGKVHNSHSAAFKSDVRDLAKKIAKEVKGLRGLIPAIGTKPSLSNAVSPGNTLSRPYGRMRRVSPLFALGQLKAVLKVVGKCRRDAPYIEARGGAKLTVEQRGVIEHEIGRILLGTRRLKQMVAAWIPEDAPAQRRIL